LIAKTKGFAVANSLRMDMINKFYSSAVQTVSTLSGVLPGNNVTREYEVLEQVCTAGVGESYLGSSAHGSQHIVADIM